MLLKSVYTFIDAIRNFTRMVLCFLEYTFVLSVHFLNYVFRLIIILPVALDVNTCMLVEWNMTYVI
jgi:hypothetical protein